MRRIESDRWTPYPVYFCEVNSLEELRAFSALTRFFTILVCADFGRVETEVISRAAEALMRKGNVYFCAWGPDCQRAHDIYDKVVVEKELEEKKGWFVMTTWHDDERLEETLWFFLFNATVDDRSREECSTIIVTVDSSRWKAEIERDLFDIGAFNERILAKELE